MAWTDAPKKVPTPDEIMLGGIRYLNAKKAAEECDFSYQGLLKRINNGEIPGAKKHSPGKGFQAVWYVPENELPTEKRKPGKPSKEQQSKPDAEQVFPGLHRNADGVPSPQKLNADLPEVSCSDCPHCENKKNRCYGLTRDAKMHPDGTLIYSLWWCHRVGRKVAPLPEWIEAQKPVQIVAEEAAETPKPSMPELQNIEKAFGNFKNFLDTVVAKPSPSPLHQALLYLESQVASLDEEAAELEAALDSLAERVKRAKAAIEAIRAFEGMETEATR